VQIVGISLVRNEERFVRRALLNVSDFCDRILVCDHGSNDATPRILAALGEQIPHLEVRRISHSAESHRLLEPLAGTDTWVLSVDGDELYDPAGLTAFRTELAGGRFSDEFRVRPAALHCDELDERSARASGYLSPPSRPLVGILNFAAVESWTGVRSERLHGGEIVFRPGYSLERWRHLGSEEGWDAPFRALHVCFLARSAHESENDDGRPNLSESGRFRVGLAGVAERLVRRGLRRPHSREPGRAWKAQKYRRGARVEVDVSSILERA
jgi:hypothetical protein